MSLHMAFLRATLLVFVCTCASAFGQEKKPEAYLRVSHECAEWVQDAATGRTACQKFKSHSDPEKFFSVEIYMPVRLAEATYNSLKGVPVKDKDGVVKKVEKPVLGVLFVDDEEKPEYKIEISPYDSQRLPAVDESNPAPSYGRTRFVIYLPKTFNTTQSLSVSLDRYTIDVPVNETKDRRFIVGVKKEFTAALTTKADVRGCYKQLTARVAYNNEQTVIYLPELGMRQLATRKQVPLKYLADPTLPASAPLTESDIDASHYQKYVKWRIGTIYDWLNQLKGDSNRLSNVRFAVEDVSVILKPPAELNAVEQDGNFNLPDGSKWQPKETDLPVYKAVSAILVPPQRQGAEISKEVFTCFDTDKRLPDGDFNVIMRFNGQDAPPELVPAQGPVTPPALPPPDLAKTGLKGPGSEAAPGQPDPATVVGERPIEKDLDIAGSYTRALEEKDEEDPADPNKTIKVRRYISRGTLDLILRPFGTRPQICRPPAFFSCDPNLHHDDPAGNTAIYRSFTPFFVDARVSTGKITEDTLSLNRVVLGTEGEYRYVLRNETYPTFFRFIGRFVNASDRDFKQAEYKGTFEFRPVFAAINHPLSTGRTRQNAVIVGPGNQDDPQKEVASERGGYEFVPFFGGELGRTWARRNPAEAVEASDAVKRLYLGIDITLNPFKRTTLTLTDTFYFKYESKDDRRDNYFKGNIDFLLGKFFGYDRIGQSIFFSFERGQVPPFNDPGVSALKFGYRIAGASVFRRVGNF